jgi:hypothetical protein
VAVLARPGDRLVPPDEKAPWIGEERGMTEPIIAKAYPTLSAVEVARAVMAHVRSEPERPRTPDQINEDVAVFLNDRFPRLDEAVGREALAIVAARVQSDPAYAPHEDEIDPLRAVEPFATDELDIGPIENEQPIFEWVDPKTLFVDPVYQRNVGDKGRKLIRKIIERFDWNRYTPPKCAYALYEGRTVLKVTDGQHTAIAASSHPDVEKIPVMIIVAPETSQQADAFVGQNTQRLPVSKLQIHASSLVAGDVEAETVQEICNQSGVQILRGTPGKYEAGDTVAVGAIYALFNKHGMAKTKIVLRTLARARLAPILEDEIKAAALLLTNADYCNEITPEALSEAITGLNLVDRDEAKQLAASKNMAFWRALAAIWFRRTKKSRRKGKAA